MEKHLELLGRQVKDKVTGFVGVVESICFDLYGCVQAVVRQKVGKDGKQMDAHYFDVKRLDPVGARVMPKPAFGPVGTEAGPAQKPAR